MLKLLLTVYFVLQVSAQNEVGCGETVLSGNIGTISSPGYPENYTNDITCEYTINVDTMEGIIITFSSFDIENEPETPSSCPYDFVEIFENEVSLGQYCGEIVPSPITTVSSSVRIVFSSDDSENRMGFSLSWEAVVGCGELEFSGNTGTISSPGYPEDYPNDITCNYIINVEPTQAIMITFLGFIIEDEPDCQFDYVEIIENEDSLGRYCGNDLPSPITTMSSSVTIVFRSDDSENRMGFSLSWEAIDTSEPTTTASEPTTTASESTTTASEPTTTASESTTTASESTTTESTTTASESTTTEPTTTEPTTTESTTSEHTTTEPTTTASEPTTTASESTTTESTTTASESTTTESTTTEPTTTESTTTASESTTTASEPTTSTLAPTISTIAACTGINLEEFEVWRNAVRNYQLALQEHNDAQQNQP